MEITDKTIQDKFTTSPLTMQVKLEGMKEIQKDLKEMEKTLDLIIEKYELIKSYSGENKDLRKMLSTHIQRRVKNAKKYTKRNKNNNQWSRV